MTNSKVEFVQSCLEGESEMVAVSTIQPFLKPIKVAFWCLQNCCCTLIFTFMKNRRKKILHNKVPSNCSLYHRNDSQICVCGRDLHAGWTLAKFYQWHISSSPHLQKKWSSNSSFCCTMFMRKTVTIIGPTLIEDRRNSPVLVPVPIRKFQFPVLQLKRSSGRATVKSFENVE